MRGKVRCLIRKSGLYPWLVGETLWVLSRELRWSDLALSRAAGRGSGGDRLSRGAAGHWARPECRDLKEAMVPALPSRNICTRSSKKARICIFPRTSFLVCWGR